MGRSLILLLSLCASLRGLVTDVVSGDPVSYAAVTVDGRSYVADAAGRFVVSDLEPGVLHLTVRHVAYATETRHLAFEDDATVRIELQPAAGSVEEVVVRADRVEPRTSTQRTSYRLTADLWRDYTPDDLVDVARLVPGVVISGGRPFFRGLGAEHVLPTVDGVPVREPITGRWVMPPPEAIGAASYTPSGNGVRFGQSLGGVFDAALRDGGSRLSARLTYTSDGFALASTAETATDIATLSVRGPTPWDALFFSLSWRGRLADGYAAFDQGRPDHEWLGIATGARMTGEETTSLKLTHAPSGGSIRSRATVLYTRTTDLDYLDQYRRFGSVGYDSTLRRYTFFLDDVPDTADAMVTYVGPLALPDERFRAVVAILTSELRLTDRLRADVHLSGSDFDFETGTSRTDGLSRTEVRDWLSGDAATDPNRQLEPFYSTHGLYPFVEEGASREVAAGVTGRLRLPAHRLLATAGFRAGRVRYFRGVLAGAGFSGSDGVVGRRGDELGTTDTYTGVQDTWFADGLASMQIGLRYDHRRITGYLGRASAETFSPHIAFRQPMTDRDAIHVFAGIHHQFPTFQKVFVNRLSESGPEIRAQRSRAFDVGIQRLFSERVSGFVSLFAREDSDLVLAPRPPSDYEAAFGNVETSPDAYVAFETRSIGLAMTCDYQIGAKIGGQVSGSVQQTLANDEEAPWSRRWSVRGWTTALLGNLRLRSSWSVDAGRRYAVCLRRGCAQNVYRGTLPAAIGVDLAASYLLGRRSSPLRLFGEVRNLLDRRNPTYDFSTYPMSTTSANFLAYYHLTGESNGYATDNGQTISLTEADNPLTRSVGRNVRLGIEYAF